MIIYDLKPILKADGVYLYIGKRSVKEHYFPLFNKTQWNDFFEKYGEKELIEISTVNAGERHIVKLRIDKIDQ